jgi:hypothetical protein
MLAPGATVVIRLQVNVASSSASSAGFAVRVSSVAGTPIDAVKALVNAL